MYFGRSMLGKFVPFGVNCVALGSGAQPATPDAAPIVTVFNIAGAVVVPARPMPAWSPGNAPVLFGFGEFLGSAYSVGYYCARITYAVSGVHAVKLLPFSVMEGGDPSGPYTALYWYDRPESQFLVGNTESGNLEYRSNPSV